MYFDPHIVHFILKNDLVSPSTITQIAMSLIVVIISKCSLSNLKIIRCTQLLRQRFSSSNIIIPFLHTFCLYLLPIKSFSKNFKSHLNHLKLFRFFFNSILYFGADCTQPSIKYDKVCLLFRHCHE